MMKVYYQALLAGLDSDMLWRQIEGHGYPTTIPDLHTVLHAGQSPRHESSVLKMWIDDDECPFMALAMLLFNENIQI